MRPNILVFAGSTRRDSLNRRLARAAAEAVRAAGGQATLLELAEYPLPLYDGDLEMTQGLPEQARALKEIFIAHDGLMIVSPEYNASLPSLLKNTLDWVSRPLPGQTGYVPFEGRVAALLSASPGSLGGLRGLRHLRDVLTELRMIVLPRQLSLPAAQQAFDEDGSLRDAVMRGRLEELIGDLLAMAGRLA
jgi:NAD(P)H-dependent FMN reductase